MPEEVYQFSNGIRVRRSDLLESQIARYGAAGNPNLHEPVEEQWILRVMERAGSTSPAFLDIGAGIGYYAALVKKRWPAARVFAVEALPRHAAAIGETMKLNDIDPAGLTILQAAIGARNGKAAFTDDGYGSRLAGLFGRKNAIDVETRRLDDVLKQTGHIDVMKMDIQGGELTVLKSARKSLRAGMIGQMVVGTHGQKIHAALRHYLADVNYDILFDDGAPLMQPDGLIVAGISPAV